MSRDYAEKRIQEALKLTKGNALKARQQVIAWTYEDSKLLHELTKPHLNGIVAYNIERVASGRAARPTEPGPEKPKTAQKPNQSLNEFGSELLKALSGSGAIFGLENNLVSARRTQASKQHQSAIQKLASKSKTPKSDKT